VNWADLMAALCASGTDFYDRSILRPKHRAYYRSGRPVIKIVHTKKNIFYLPGIHFNVADQQDHTMQRTVSEKW